MRRQASTRLPAVLVLALVARCADPASVPSDDGATDRPIADSTAPVDAGLDVPVDRVEEFVDRRGDAPPDRAASDAPALDPDAGFDVPRDTGGDVPADVPADVAVLPSSETWVPAGARWRYLDTGVAPPSTWRAATFADDAWRSGDAQLGYGDGDEATVVSSGTDPSRRHPTTWFRQRFDVRGRDGFVRVLLRLLRDDGAVVYLNDREVFRSNLPVGPIAPSTLATEVVGGADEDEFHEVMLEPSVVQEGSNVVAVEVHQSAANSSDLSFDLALIGYRPETPGPTGPTLLAAGDIARCDSSADEATARLLDGLGGTVVTLGDSVYESGTDQEFRDCYAPTWGRHRARTRPASGNHEYNTPGAAPYYRYFGAAAGLPTEGWYSYELGAWHVVVLNSNCADVGGCGAGSPQERWLRADLAAHPARCTVAAWHHPRFSTGAHGDDPRTADLWRALESAGADVVLSGHDHDYERFAPLRSDGARDDARGLREFVVGTGGTRLRPFTRTSPYTEASNATAHGVLRLSLETDGYAWRFIPVAGQTWSDSGRAACH